MSKRNTNRNKFIQNNQQFGKKTKGRKQDNSNTNNASTHVVEEPTLVLSQYGDNVMSVIPKGVDAFKLHDDGFITITLKKKNTSGIKDIKRALYFGAYQREEESSIMHDIKQEMLAFIKEINEGSDKEIQDFASKISIMQLRVITDMFKAKMLSLVQSVEYDSEKNISIKGLEAYVKSNLCVIVGDINGNIIDFVKTVNSALGKIKENANAVYVFLGNYTGIGKDNIDVLLLMMILMITYDNFVFLRGPNENIATIFNMYNKMSEGSINKMDDMDDINNLESIEEMNDMSMFSSQSNFIKDINEHGAFVHGYDSNNDFFMDDNNNFLLNNSEDGHSFNFKYSFFKNIVSVFRYLPIACIVNEKYYCVHGGVPSDIARYIELTTKNLPLNIIKDEDANESTLVLYDALSNRPYATSEDYNTKHLERLSRYYGKSDVDQFIKELNKNNRDIKTLVVSDLSEKDTMRRDNMIVVYSSNIVSIIDPTMTNRGTYYITTLDKIIPFDYATKSTMFNTIDGVDLDPVFKLVLAMIHGNDTAIDITKNEITALCEKMTTTDSSMFDLADFIKSIFSVYDMYSGEEKILSEDATVDLYQLDDEILQLATSQKTRSNTIDDYLMRFNKEPRKLVVTEPKKRLRMPVMSGGNSNYNDNNNKKKKKEVFISLLDESIKNNTLQMIKDRKKSDIDKLIIPGNNYKWYETRSTKKNKTYTVEGELKFEYNKEWCIKNHVFKEKNNSNSVINNNENVIKANAGNAQEAMVLKSSVIRADNSALNNLILSFTDGVHFMQNIMFLYVKSNNPYEKDDKKKSSAENKAKDIKKRLLYRGYTMEEDYVIPTKPVASSTVSVTPVGKDAITQSPSTCTAGTKTGAGSSNPDVSQDGNQDVNNLGSIDAKIDNTVDSTTTSSASGITKDNESVTGNTATTEIEQVPSSVTKEKKNSAPTIHYFTVLDMSMFKGTIGGFKINVTKDGNTTKKKDDKDDKKDKK